MNGEKEAAVLRLDLSVAEASYLYRLVKRQGYLEDDASATAYRKLEECLFSSLSLEEILEMEGGRKKA